jgi:hypothetical protein
MSAIYVRGYTVGVENKIEGLGPWTHDDLARTALEQAGVGSTSDLPPSVRFIAGVVKLIRARLARADQETDPGQPAVFLLEPAPRSNRSESLPKRVPMLDNGLTPLTGRLWFVGAAVVSGHYVPVDLCDDDTLFRLITDDLALGNVPGVLFDPRPSIPEVRFYPSGLGSPDNCRKLPLGGSDIPLEQIFDAITNIYSSCLITPDAQTPASKLWQQSNKWYPVKNAEAIIQWSLKSGLVAAFPSCIVRHEQPGVPGRIDLEIEEINPVDRGVIVHAVLELKVLRSYGSEGIPVTSNETLSWIESGVKQAAAYRDDRGARAAALCCFDMRKEDLGDSCFAHVLSLADQVSVMLRRWYVFASSSLYRDVPSGRYN